MSASQVKLHFTEALETNDPNVIEAFVKGSPTLPEAGARVLMRLQQIAAPRLAVLIDEIHQGPARRTVQICAIQMAQGYHKPPDAVRDALMRCAPRAYFITDDALRKSLAEPRTLASLLRIQDQALFVEGVMEADREDLVETLKLIDDGGDTDQMLKRCVDYGLPRSRLVDALFSAGLEFDDQSGERAAVEFVTRPLRVDDLLARLVRQKLSDDVEFRKRYQEPPRWTAPALEVYEEILTLRSKRVAPLPAPLMSMP